jgi:hypothetical protein
VEERHHSVAGSEAPTSLGSLARSCRGRRSIGDPAEEAEAMVVAEQGEVTWCLEFVKRVLERLGCSRSLTTVAINRNQATDEIAQTNKENDNETRRQQRHFIESLFRSRCEVSYRVLCMAFEMSTAAANAKPSRICVPRVCLAECTAPAMKECCTRRGGCVCPGLGASCCLYGVGMDCDGF